jgi:soluble lytic murein transglycosylase-like protein
MEGGWPVKRPTDQYTFDQGLTPERLIVRGALLLLTAMIIAGLAGWTRRVRATEHVTPPDARLVAREFGSLSDQLDRARGESALLKLQLDRANAILASSARYHIPADLAGGIYDIALSEGIDPALGFRLVKIESSFRGDARSPAGALGYTQLQLATARFYDADITPERLLQREVNLRLGFRFFNDLLEKFGRNTDLALLAYNRGPAKVAEIIAAGGNPTNGYSDAVLKGYRAPGAGSK